MSPGKLILWRIELPQHHQVSQALISCHGRGVPSATASSRVLPAREEASLRIALPNHLRLRREKVFGDGPRIPLDREAKVRIMHLARTLKHKTEPGKHYGILTGKFVDVLHAMLWLIHDGRSGQCNPAYATIADKAGCAMSTVCEAIKALELAGLLSWVNRIVRVRIRERDLFGQWATTWRVLRTSNAYVL
jgi:hypothetical protein